MSTRHIIIAWLLAGFAPALAGEPSPAPSPPDAAAGLIDPAAQVMALGADRHARFTLPVLVEGTGPYDFMIDTGSQATAVTAEIRTIAALSPAGTATLVGMASRREVEMVDVGRIEFGANSYTNFAAPVLSRENVGADGIIGLDALQDFRVLVDFRKQTIAVEDATAKEKPGGYEIVVRARSKLGQLLITDAVVDGVKATVIIDTGAQASLGNLALRDKIRARRAHDAVTTDVNGVDIVGQVSFVRNLTIAGLSMQDVPLTFADTPAFAALGLEDKPVLSIGMQHLSLFDRVAIDFANQRILFDVPADVARAIRAAQRGSSYSPRF